MENTNDWVVANMSLPGAQYDEFNKNGITPDNTTLEGKDFYKDTKKVQEMFTVPETGKFDEDKYNKFYDTMLYTYNEYSNKDYLKKADANYDYSPFDVTAPQNAKKRDDLYKVEKVKNPFNMKIGIEGFNAKSKPNLSMEEIAQGNYVRDHVSGNALDWTPNDDSATGIFDFLTRPTLVLGQYDSDGVHYDELEGRDIAHNKGDYKLDADGKPFFETLGDREVYNREVLNWSDTLTKEGTWLNKYDFMDSDGLTKSAIGSIMKTAVKVVPLFIPYVGEVYAAGILGQDIMNIAPILIKAGVGTVVGDRDVDKAYWKQLNKIQGFSGKLTSSSVSDYGKNKMFSFENISSMMGDVFTQLYTQRAIASIPGYLGMTKGSTAAVKAASEAGVPEELIEKMVGGSLSIAETRGVLERIPELGQYINRAVKNTKLSKGLATTYMAATSAAGVAAQAKEIGLDERDTGLLYLGTAAGFFGMMTSLPIGEWALKGIGLEEAGMLVNKGITKEAKPFMDQLKRLGAEVTKSDKGAQKLFKIGKSIGTAVGSKLKNVDGYIAAMSSEGTEEITEQFMQDGITNIYNGLSAMGLTSTDKKNKFTYGSGSDIFANYAMNFFGGAAGGAMFHFKDRMSNGARDDDASTKDIYWLIRNGYKSKLDEETNKLIKKGYFGSTSLTTEQINVDIPGLGRRTTFKPKAGSDMSQNEAIGGIMLNLYNNVEQQIFQEGLSPDVEVTNLLNARYDLIVKDLKVNSPLYEDFDKITNDILTINSKIDKALEQTTIPDAPLSSVDKAKKEVQSLQVELGLKREELKKITTGEIFPEYQAQALFYMSEAFNGPFGNMNANDLALAKFKKSYKSLTTEQKLEIDADQIVYKEANQKDILKAGYKKFTYLNQKTSPHIAELARYAAQRAGHHTLVDVLGNTSKFNLQTNTLGEINKAKSYLNKTLTTSESLNRVIKGEKDVESIEKATDDILSFVGNPSIDRFDKSFTDEMRGVFSAPTLIELGGKTMSLNSVLEGDQYFEENGLGDYFDLTLDDLLEENITSIVTKLNNLREQLGSEAEITINKLQAYIFANPAIASLESKRQLFEGTVKGRTINTLNELLTKFEFIQNGTTSDINQILTNEFESLGKIQSITDYQIYNPEVQENLEDAKVLLEQLQSIIIAATDYNKKNYKLSGYNTVINSTFPEMQLPTITQEQSSILLSEIQQIGSKIKLFLQLSAYNKESKIKNLIAAGVNMETLFYEQLKEGNFRKLLDSIEINGETVMTPELIDAIEGSGTATLQKSLSLQKSKEGEMISSEEEVHQLEKEKLGVQKAFYERMQDLMKRHGAEVVQEAIFNNDIAKKIFPTSELSNPTNTDFSAIETVIQPYALFVWANTLMTVDPAELYTELRGTELEDGKYDGIEQAKFVPFYAQEYIIKVALGMLDNKKWIQNSMSFLGNKEDAETFLGKINETFNDLVFIDGIPGSGKTTAVGYTIARILKRRGDTFWTAGAYDSQAIQLAQTLENPDTNSSFNKKGLLEKFFTTAAVSEIIGATERCLNKRSVGEALLVVNGDNTLITIGRSVEKINEEKFERLKVSTIAEEAFLIVDDSILPKVIFVDEITHFSMIELEALRQAFNRIRIKKLGGEPPTIMSLGDSMQNGFEIAGEPHNINMFRSWGTPKLSASLRTSSNLKNDNLVDIRSRYSLIAESYNKIFTKELDTYAAVKEEINKLHNSSDDSTWFKLRQYTDETGIVYGEKVTSKDNSAEELKNLIANTTGKIGFITDNDSIDSNKILKALTADQLKRLDIKTPATVQGLEYDHVMIDINWNEIAKDANFGPINFISNIYTLSTRSRVGSIIIDKGFSTNNSLIVKQINSKQQIDVKLDKKLLDKYKETRVKEVTALANLFDIIPIKAPVPLAKAVKVPQSETIGLAEELMKQEEAAYGKTTPKVILSDDLRDNSLYTYPYYERVGVENEDGYLFPVDGKPNTKMLSDIKNLIFYGKDKDTIQEFLEESGIENISNIKVVVRGSRYDSTTDLDQIAVRSNQIDKTKELSSGSKNVKADVFLRTALKIERIDPSTGESLEPFYITLGVFASPKSTIKSGIVGLISNLANLTSKIESEIIANDENPVDLEIDVKDPFSLLRYSTGIQLRNLNEPVSFSEFKSSLGEAAVISPIYIFTGNDSSAVGSKEVGVVDAWVKKRKLAGKAVVFVSYNKDLSESQLKEIFVSELLKGTLVPTVKVVLLNPKGTPAKAWFERAWDTIAENKIKDKKDRYPISTLASRGMVDVMINAIATIADSDKYKGNTLIIKKIANEIISRLGPDGMGMVHFDANKASFNAKSKMPKVEVRATKTKIRLGAQTSSIQKKGEGVEALDVSVFPENYTYKLLIGLGIAMNGGVDIQTKGELGTVFEPVDRYTDHYGDFLNELYKILDEQFPDGIHAHPVYQAYGARSDKDDYVQLAMENYEDFQVGVLPTLPDAVIDLRMLLTASERKEQQEIVKAKALVDITLFAESKANLITDPSILSQFKAEIGRALEEFIQDNETNPKVIKSKIASIFNNLYAASYTKEALFEQLRARQWDNTEVSLEDALSEENEIINKAIGVFVISGNNSKFDFEITYNMNELNEDKKMLIQTKLSPIEEETEIAKLKAETIQMVTDFHAENTEFMLPGVLENVMAALNSDVREIIPGSPTQIAFTQLATQASLLGNDKLYEALRDYTNTQNIKSCNS